MIENYVSLLLFTYIGQAAIGLILVRETLISAGIISREDQTSKKSQYAITLMLLTSLGIAFMHLHNPLKAVYALSNLTNSPLSMEIGSLTVLLGLSVILSYITFKSTNGRFRRGLSLLSAIFAVILLATMMMVYYLPSVPAWNRPATPIAFVFTVVSAGTALFAIMLTRENSIAAIRLTGYAVIATIALLIVSLSNDSPLSSPFSAIFIAQSLAALWALILLIILITGGGMNKMHQMTVIIIVLIILSGIMARLQFFLSFDNNIL